MSKIPKTTQEAVDEAYLKIVRKYFATMSDEDMKAHLQKYHDELKERQPAIHTFVKRMCAGHTNLTQGNMQIAQYALYTMIMIESLYVQKEMDDITDIFNQEGIDDGGD